MDLSLLMPDNAGELTYALSEASGDATYSVREDTFVYRLAEGLTEDDVQSIEVPVTITSQNYEDSTVNMIVRITDKYVPVLAPDDVVATYDGAPVEDSAITGSATVNGFDVSGEWSFVQGQNITNVKDSGLKFVTFTPADLSAYETVKDTVLVTHQQGGPRRRAQLHRHHRLRPHSGRHGAEPGHHRHSWYDCLGRRGRHRSGGQHRLRLDLHP